MSDRIEPMTHIDIRVVRNLLWSRLNEGRDIVKSGTASKDWCKIERVFQEKCRKALDLIDEAIDIKVDDKHKEVKTNEVSNSTPSTPENPNQAPSEGYTGTRYNRSQGQRS